MDDFRVGSVPNSDPYGTRRQSGSIRRKREKHPDHEQPDEEPDGIETSAAGEDSGGETIEDYYTPSNPGESE